MPAWVFHQVNTRFRLGLFHRRPDCEMIRKLAAGFFVGTFVRVALLRVLENQTEEMRDGSRVGSKLCALDHDRLRDIGISELGQRPARAPPKMVFTEGAASPPMQRNSPLEPGLVVAISIRR